MASTRKLGVSIEVAQRKIELLAHLDIISIEHTDIVQAIDIHRLHKFSFWDSLNIRMAQKQIAPFYIQKICNMGNRLVMLG